MKNGLTRLAKSVLISLGLMAAASAMDEVIQNKIYGSVITTLIISNKEMKVIMKILKSLEESGLLIENVSKAIESETREQKGRFFGILFGTLTASKIPER